MPDELMGQRVKELVRRYFMEGRKSSNKLYTSDMGGTVTREDNKADKRERDQYAAQFCLYEIQNDFKRSEKLGSANYAIHLLQLKADVRSGNCGEMADMAAYLANECEHIPADQIYIGILSSPGQHVFCLVADAVIPRANRSAQTLFGFCKAAQNHLIIDPWLNTACLSGAYIRRTRERLIKWAGDGKRISWNGSQGQGWYPPAGEYMAAMQRAPVDLYSFS